jgi:hypothetical protein
MKPLFTIHEGEFLVGDHINRRLGRGFSIRKEMERHLIATSWFTLDPGKVRRSEADLWVFVILTLKHDEHFVLIPTRELKRRIPRGLSRKWNLYLWVFDDNTCYQVRDLSREETLDIPHRGVRDSRRDFTDWLENWRLLEKFTRKAR